MAKGLKFYYEFSTERGEDFGKLHRIEILVEGFSGSATQLLASNNPFNFYSNKDISENYLGGLTPTNYSLEAIKTVEFNASSFANEKYGDIVFKYYIDSVLQTTGVISPFEGYDMDLPDGISVTTIGAECGLVSLKNSTYTLQGARTKLIVIIDNILKTIPENTFGIEVIDNTKCYDINVLLKGLYFDQEIDDTNFLGLSNYEVLKQILKEYHQLVFSNGLWSIRNIAEISGGDSVRKVYVNGVQTVSENYNRPTIDVQRLTGGSFGKMFSQQNITVVKSKSNLRNVFADSEFTSQGGWTYVGFAGAFFSIEDGLLKNNGNSTFTDSNLATNFDYVQSVGTPFYPYKGIYTPGETLEGLKVKIKGTKGSGIKNLRLQIYAIGGNTVAGSYLNSDGTWYTREGANSGTPIYELTYSDGQEVVIDIPTPPYFDPQYIPLVDNLYPIGYFNNLLPNQEVPPSDIQYTLYVRVFLPERNTYDNVTSLNTEANIDYIRIERSNENSALVEGYEKNFGVDIQADRKSNLTVNVGIGEDTYPLGLDALYASDGTPIAKYAKHGGIASFSIDEYISRAYLSVLSNRLTYYEGSVFGKVSFTDLIAIDSSKYRVHNLSFNSRSNTSTIKIVELFSSTSTGIVVQEENIATENSDLYRQIYDDVVKNFDTFKLTFNDPNIQKVIGTNGQSLISLKPDVRHNSMQANEVYLKAVGDGIITDVAESTTSDFTLIKPAKNGTYALLSDITEQAWLLTANTLTAKAFLGSLNNFDVGFKRNDVEYMTLNASGVTVTQGLTLGNIQAETTDVDRFLVSNAGLVKYRTGVQLLSDIGAFATPTGLTTNYVTKWNGTALANSLIFDNGTNVGIGTANPTLGKLQVVGAIYQQSSDASGVGIYTNGALRFLSNQNFIDFNNAGAANNISFRNGSGVRTDLFISATGNIGIGNTNNTYKLDVNGTGHFTGAVLFDAIASCAISPTLGSHLANKAYVDSLSFIKKGENVLTISLANITLSGTQTVNGVALVAGNLILVAGQTTGSQNGVYTVASGAWTRSTLNDTDTEIRGAYHLITNGTYANQRFINTNATTITVGTTAITYALDFGAETDPIFVGFRDTSRGANLVYASGDGTSAGIGTWRGLVQADIPTLNWSKITATPTTIAGYGITDAYTKIESDALLATKENTITAGTTSQYWRGDKTWQTLDKSTVGLGNVENTALSTWVGSTNITTLGTIGTGTWNGTTIGISKGGTGLTTLGTANQLLRVNAGATALEYFTPTYISGNQSITITGDATGTGTTSIALTLANSGVTAGTYAKVTVDAKGRVTSGATLLASDIPNLDWAKITTGKPTTIGGYGITDFYSQVVSGFVTGANSTVLNTDSLEVALEKLQGQVNARLTDNQTINLSGIITGSGTTSITTSIADNALTIAKTSGLQSALDSKMTTASYPDIVAIEALVGTTGLLRKTATNTWSLDTTSYQTALSGTGFMSANGSTISYSKNINLENTTFANQNGVIQKNGVAWIHDFNYGTYNSVNTIGQNIFVGSNNFVSGKFASQTWHGSYNVAVGGDSLLVNTTGAYNSSLGHNTLVTNLDGTYNTAIGFSSMYFNFSGYSNVGVGALSLYSNTNGYQNTAIGISSLYTNTTGYDNIGIGYRSMYLNTTGYFNTAIGRESLYSNTGGFANVSVGSRSLYSNTTGRYNIGIGLSSLYLNTTGQFNTAIGYESLYANTTGNYNTALGASALRGNSTGSNNLGLGIQSLGGATLTGSFNVGVGRFSLFRATSGISNTAIGYNSGYDLTTGSNNVFLGYQSGLGITTGSNNIVIGANTTGLSSSLSNYIILGDNAGFRRFIINDIGNAGIGLDNPLYKLHVNGDIKADTNLIVNGFASFGTTNPLTISQTQSIQGTSSDYFNEITSLNKWLRINTDSGFSLRHNGSDAISFVNGSWKFNTPFAITMGEEVNDWIGFDIDDRFRIGINETTGLAAVEMVYENSIIRNYWDSEGIFTHVDNSGNSRKYLREGDIIGGGGSVSIPNLQQVTAEGANSSIRMQFNGTNYATMSDLGNSQGLDSVLGNNNTANEKIVFLNGLNSAYTLGYDGTSKFMVSHTSAGVLSVLQTAGTQFNLTAASSLTISAPSNVHITSASTVSIGGLDTNVNVQAELVSITSDTQLAIQTVSGDLSILSNAGFVNLGYYNPQYSKTRLGRPDSGDYIYMNGQKYNFSLPSKSAGAKYLFNLIDFGLSTERIDIQKINTFASGGQTYLVL